jgi:hypothetical protein
MGDQALKARRRQQAVQLGDGSVSTSGPNHHLNVPELSRAPLVRGADDVFDDQQPSMGLHGVPARDQNPGCVRVGPVMQNVLQDIYVPAGRDRAKEIARCELDAIAESWWDRPASGFNDCRHVQQHAARPWMAPENLRQQHTPPSSHIHNRPVRTEIKSGHNRLGIGQGDFIHQTVEQPSGGTGEARPPSLGRARWG